LKPEGRLLYTLAEIRISKCDANICGKVKTSLHVLLLKPVTCEHHLAVRLTAARPEALGCGSGLGPGR